MIYASDLDQTLIYSKRSLGVPLESPGLLPAEHMEGETAAFISAQALQLLKTLSKDVIFMPVTTRTMAQYRRITVFQTELVPAYAVTSNGGNIIVGGEVDREWNRRIHEQVRRDGANAEEARHVFGQVLHEDWVVSERFCDELFYAFVIERDRMPLEQVLEKARIMREMGWEVSIQGRKVYLVPAAVNKQAAVEHIRNLTDGGPIVASGDSLLDRCLLDYADYAIAPRHGELYREQLRDELEVNYRFTEGSGVYAADEIMAYVHEVQLISREIGDKAL
ncbi:hydrolase (had superfamily) protein [Paenibacillus terrae HPL-003]|uniref:Hydrolase (Had superfamily) protein n=1 Tax=Paenibacillus terrae (strain HPL-003) TaxID=985665 RepID=G7W444_PAETH|nr:HAD family hydrolase [Paenibacillus terrae]AET59284.1 hydrolase (had superfamily) protein [Paenibacillus terrae HPL-003]